SDCPGCSILLSRCPPIVGNIRSTQTSLPVRRKADAPACRDAGRADNDVALIDVDTRFRDFGDYWSPFLGSHGPAPVFAMLLGEISRERLRERIRDRRPIRSDGSIHLI